ncbi:hypothetical protein QTP70_016107 [Hemibagrus guttatus]|uniref:Calponin-homology (CH) domain-containing protein n=1 Tax=Hemibagrus guttatus TaxID=175788 RepID=A0AAE0UZS4_9TELE|nr:hypothetical protein QTP70_016107 [Hemibagrus guttatus]
MDKVVESEQGNEGAFQAEQQMLVEWINSTLKPEHIVIQNLEEDIYDGLVIHHLLGRLGGVRLAVEEIALTSAAQMSKLELTLQALNKELGLGDEADRKAKWSAKLIHSRDLLATLHLMVAIVRRYQPELALPQNVSVEVLMFEVNKGGIKSDKQIEYITLQSEDTEGSKNDPIDELLKLDAHKIATVEKALLHFINKNMSPLRLQVSDIEKQLHNVTLALDLLNDKEIQVQNVDPEDIVSQDVPATLKVLYALFKKHKNK